MAAAQLALAFWLGPVGALAAGLPPQPTGEPAPAAPRARAALMALGLTPLLVLLLLL